MRFLDKALSLPKGKFSQWKDLPTYLFWWIPAYAGMFLALRDKLEKVEVAYRAAFSGLAVFALPRVLEQAALKRLKAQHIPKWIGSKANAAFILQLASGVVFYASIPTILNLFLRKKRANHLGLTQTPPASMTTKIPARPVSRLNAPLVYPPGRNLSRPPFFISPMPSMRIRPALFLPESSFPVAHSAGFSPLAFSGFTPPTFLPNSLTS